MVALSIDARYNKAIRHEGVLCMANIPRLRAVLSQDAMRSAWRQPLAVIYWPYTTNPRDTLVTNVIRTVKINIPRLSTYQHSGLEPPSL
jgi:hypothetical protein